MTYPAPWRFLQGKSKGDGGMNSDLNVSDDGRISCAECQACCCRLEVLLISDTGVPNVYIETDQWGGQRMARLDDGWCSALDRHTMLCTIYEQRPWICRAFAAGDHECLTEREAHL